MSARRSVPKNKKADRQGRESDGLVWIQSWPGCEEGPRNAASGATEPAGVCLYVCVVCFKWFCSRLTLLACAESEG